MKSVRETSTLVEQEIRYNSPVYGKSIEELNNSSIDSFSNGAIKMAIKRSQNAKWYYSGSKPFTKYEKSTLPYKDLQIHGVNFRAATIGQAEYELEVALPKENLTFPCKFNNNPQMILDQPEELMRTAINNGLMPIPRKQTVASVLMNTFVNTNSNLLNTLNLLSADHSYFFKVLSCPDKDKEIASRPFLITNVFRTTIASHPCLSSPTTILTSLRKSTKLKQYAKQIGAFSDIAKRIQRMGSAFTSDPAGYSNHYGLQNLMTNKMQQTENPAELFVRAAARDWLTFLETVTSYWCHILSHNKENNDAGITNLKQMSRFTCPIMVNVKTDRAFLFQNTKLMPSLDIVIQSKNMKRTLLHGKQMGIIFPENLFPHSLIHLCLFSPGYLTQKVLLTYIVNNVQSCQIYGANNIQSLLIMNELSEYYAMPRNYVAGDNATFGILDTSIEPDYKRQAREQDKQNKKELFKTSQQQRRIAILIDQANKHETKEEKKTNATQVSLYEQGEIDSDDIVDDLVKEIIQTQSDTEDSESTTSEAPTDLEDDFSTLLSFTKLTSQQQVALQNTLFSNQSPVDQVLEISQELNISEKEEEQILDILQAEDPSTFLGKCISKLKGLWGKFYLRFKNLLDKVMPNSFRLLWQTIKEWASKSMEWGKVIYSSIKTLLQSFLEEPDNPITLAVLDTTLSIAGFVSLHKLIHFLTDNVIKISEIKSLLKMPGVTILLTLLLDITLPWGTIGKVIIKTFNRIKESIRLSKNQFNCKRRNQKDPTEILNDLNIKAQNNTKALFDKCQEIFAKYYKPESTVWAPTGSFSPMNRSNIRPLVEKDPEANKEWRVAILKYPDPKQIVPESFTNRMTALGLLPVQDIQVVTVTPFQLIDAWQALYIHSKNIENMTFEDISGIMQTTNRSVMLTSIHLTMLLCMFAHTLGQGINFTPLDQGSNIFTMCPQKLFNLLLAAGSQSKLQFATTMIQSLMDCADTFRTQ